MVGASPKIREIQKVIEKIADKDSPVLLEGEFGTGKQMVARGIHNASRRTSAPFKVLQCSALPEDLLESELFGSPSSRGELSSHAPPGAPSLLEEIHVLPMRLQSKLEAYLEEIAARRLQGDLPPAMDVRFIASSAKPLQDCVAAGTFREDLYYKISVIPIEVPPLRSRPEDIGVLADYFLKRHSERTGAATPEIDKYARRLLEGYTWPGNVGELQNAMERACAFAEDGRIRPVDLPPQGDPEDRDHRRDQKTTHHLPSVPTFPTLSGSRRRCSSAKRSNTTAVSREKTASMLGVSIATLYRKMGLKLEKDKMMADHGPMGQLGPLIAFCRNRGGTSSSAPAFPCPDSVASKPPIRWVQSTGRAGFAATKADSPVFRTPADLMRRSVPSQTGSR